MKFEKQVDYWMIRFCQRNANMSTQDILSMSASALRVFRFSTLVRWYRFMFKKILLYNWHRSQDSTCQNRTFINGYKN